MSDARVSLYSLLYIHTHAAHSRLSLYWPGTAPGPGTGPFHPARGTGRLRAGPRPVRYPPVSPRPRYRTSTGQSTSGPVPARFTPPAVRDAYRPGNIRPGTGQPPRRDHRSGTNFTAGPVPDRLPHRASGTVSAPPATHWHDVLFDHVGFVLRPTMTSAPGQPRGVACFCGRVR